MTLTRSTDRKTANLANAKGNAARIANAFGLPAGRAFSCPGATSICEKVCYAGRIEKQYKNFLAVMVANFEALQGKGAGDMFTMLSAMISEFVAECEKKNAPKFFRIHHDGDFFSHDYARAWASVCRAFPDVTFWVYTRSFTDRLNVVPHIAGIANLSVYLSVDAENKHFAESIVRDYPSVRLAILTDRFDDGIEVMQDIRGNDKPGAKCPELTKQLPLITEKGGACFSCMLCPMGKADIRFAIKKR